MDCEISVGLFLPLMILGSARSSARRSAPPWSLSLSLAASDIIILEKEITHHTKSETKAL